MLVFSSVDLLVCIYLVRVPKHILDSRRVKNKCKNLQFIFLIPWEGPSFDKRSGM